MKCVILLSLLVVCVSAGTYNIDRFGRSIGGYGGKGGGAFTDGLLSYNGYITAVKVGVEKRLLRCVGLSYGGKAARCHGGKAKKYHNQKLDKDEYVIQAEVCFKRYINMLRVVTNKRQIGPYGEKLSGNICKTVYDNGNILNFIAGRSGSLIDRMSFYFDYNIPCSFIKRGAYGGKGGGAFNHKGYVKNGPITQVTVRRKHNVLGCIGLKYGGVETPCEGDGRANLKKYVLEPGESITKIVVWASKLIDSITLYTNRRRIGPVGNKRGDSKRKVIRYKGNTLAYISGKSGGLVDNLAFHFNKCD